MNAKNILYIGRFQPFHKGHADAIMQIFESYGSQIKKLYIGIGSAEDNFSSTNPMTCSERFQILEHALEELNIPPEKWAIVPIRNIYHYDVWPFHVCQYLPPIDILATGSELVRCLWQKSFPQSHIHILRKRTPICASDIRNYLIKNKSIESFVLHSTNIALQKWNIAERILAIGQQ